jgi:hypothetical protein
VAPLRRAMRNTPTVSAVRTGLDVPPGRAFFADPDLRYITA